ncbi:MAG: hypothetical protein CMH53_07295 [Myxococcales bacterium]|nr:hypothetical protein [Myxococcales bacterium]
MGWRRRWRSILDLEQRAGEASGDRTLLEEAVSTEVEGTEENSVLPLHGNGDQRSGQAVLLDVPFAKVIGVGIARRQENKNYGHN